MPRKPAPAPQAEQPTADSTALKQASAALTVLGTRSAEVAERFGDGQPYERNRVVAEARFFMAQSAEAMLEAGKRLVQIKENEPHGEFIEIVEERLGLSRRTAQVMMQAAVKYLAPAIASKAQAPALLTLGKAKLLDLLAEPDESIEALAEGGTVAGLDLDDMQAMTSRELRAALVEERKKNAAKDKLLAKKDEKLNRLSEEAELRTAIGSEEQAALDAVRDATVSAEIALAQFAATVAPVLLGAPSAAATSAARQAGEYIAQRLADLLHQHDIPVSFEQMLQPEWLPTTKVHNDGKAARGRK